MKKVVVRGDDGELHVPLPQEPERLPEPEATPAPPEKPSVFPPQHMAPLNGLLFLGAIEDTVEYAGHTFHIRTLTEGETLRIGQLAKDYRGTASETEALRLYTVAACTMAVDDQPVTQPYKEGYDLIFEASKVVKGWYPPVIRKVYEAYARLEKTAMLACDSLKK